MTTLIDIILPADQLEGTTAKLAQWLVNVGDTVKQGQPIAELETDKVVMEVCATNDGVLHEKIAAVGDEIQTGVTLGKVALGVVSVEPKKNYYEPELSTNIVEHISKHYETSESAHNSISPAVRRLLLQNNLNIEHVAGTGKRGRVTKDDVLRHLAEIQHQLKGASKKQQTFGKLPEPLSGPLKSKLVPHTNMRKSIANHMVKSLLHTSPHVTSVFEMNLTNIIEHRRWHKKEFAELEVNLTITTYFLAAMVKAVQAVPQINSRFHEDALEIFQNVNIGVGTSLEGEGLIVPVIQQVEQMNLFQIAKTLTLQTEKARTGKIKPSDFRNGTITISNHGVSGSLFAAPIIINQPQVAILGIGKMEKRVIVEEVNGVDTMVIKPMCYVSLSIDHRAVDAHQTNLFLSHFVETIEHWGE